jgi:hypothetical protein
MFISAPQMQEKTLLKISLLTGIIGIIFLYLVSIAIELPTVQKIDRLAEETEVKLSGIIGKVTSKDQVAFLEVMNEKIEKTDVILFKDQDIYLGEGDYVEITGTIEDYQGRKELVGNKIVKK